MRLWQEWWRWCAPLRGACARQRTFLWMSVVLAGFCVREDLWGVTSLVRALGLQAVCYDRLLDFFHSPALNVETLTRLWAALVVNLHPGLVRCNGRLVLVGDGIKIGKAGKKMPGVKRLHQSSESNTKPEFILGHSCQAVGILAQGLSSIVAIPLAARIHEGVVFSNRDQRTLLDKMIALLASLGLDTPYYFVADAYYASRKIALPLLQAGHQLVTRGRLILMTTDLTLAPVDVIRLYGYRFKIEVSFKSALHVLGAFLYHFWMAAMTPITRKAKDQYLHRKSAAYRDAVRRKLAAYHRFIQLGLIAQGIMLALATTVPGLVWASFGSWLRTIRPGIAPSEAVVACALRNTLPHFLADNSPAPDLAKFIQERLDLSRTQAKRFAA